MRYAKYSLLSVFNVFVTIFINYFFAFYFSTTINEKSFSRTNIILFYLFLLVVISILSFVFGRLLYRKKDKYCFVILSVCGVPLSFLVITVLVQVIFKTEAIFKMLGILTLSAYSMFGENGNSIVIGWMLPYIFVIFPILLICIGAYSKKRKMPKNIDKITDN